MKHYAFLLCLGLAACGGENPAPSAVSAPVAVSATTQAASTPIALPTLNMDFSSYAKAANKQLKTSKTGLTIPESAFPTPNSNGGKNMLHDLADGLTLAVETDSDNKIQIVRVIWQPEKNPKQNQQLVKGAAALIAATLPDDPTMPKDVAAQINLAATSKDAREFVRGGIAYKVTSTNQPSVMLIAKPE